MADVIETRMYIAVDPMHNNNKFYKVEILSAPVTESGRNGKTETGHIRTTWGRVGATNCESMLLASEKDLDAKIREKCQLDKYGNPKPPKPDKPAYTLVKTVGTASNEPPKSVGSGTGVRATSEQVRKLAVAEIGNGCPITSALVKKLAECNRHELIAATGGIQKGGMDIDLETGLVRTALGVITLDAVGEARQVLDQMLPFITRNNTDNKKYADILGTYLRLVPQDVGTRRGGWHVDFINVAAQTSLLDQLETSVQLANQRVEDGLKAAQESKGTDKVVAPPAMFNAKLTLVNDPKIVDKIKKMFTSSMTRGHSSSQLKPVRFYEVEIAAMAGAYEVDGKKLTNEKLLWHGTRMFNVLSILKRGLVLPSSLSTAQTAGAMFGPGVYFSDNSTKSLNYSFGYWDGGKKDTNCYMFLVDVAMGKEYIPNGPGNGKKPGYDSCHAVPGRSGIQNDEQIVYRTSQANIKYLVEFDQ